MNPLRVLAERPLLKKLLLVVVAGVVLFAAAGFLVAPPLVRSYLLKQARSSLDREVTVGSVRVNPFTLSVTVRGLEVKEKGSGATFVAFDTLRMRLASFASLFAGAPVIASLRLEGPRVNLIRHEDGSYNFSDLLRRAASRPASGKPPRYSVNNIRVTGGEVDFDDRPTHGRHRVTGLRIGIPYISNLPSKVEIDTEPTFAANVDGRPVEVSGHARPFSPRPEMDMDLHADGLDIPKYLAYVPADLGVRIPKGTLDLLGSLIFKERADGSKALVLAGDLVAHDLQVQEKNGAPLANLPRTHAHIIAADLLAGWVSLGRLTFDSPELDLRRWPDGRLNLAALVPQGAAAPGSSKGGGFRLTAGEVTVSKGTLRWEDEAVRPAVRKVLHPLDMRVTSFDSGMRAPMGLDVSFTTEAGETFRDEGSITPEPLAAQGSVETAGLRLDGLAPYLLAVFPSEVQSGRLDGAARYDIRGEGGTLTGVLSGLSATLGGFSARLPGGKAPFLTLAAASLKDGTLDLGKRVGQLGELSVDGGRLSLNRAADGSLDIVTALAPKAGAPADAGPAWQWNVSKLALKGFAAEVQDASPSRPAHLVLDLSQVAGEDITTGPGKPGHVTLSASLNGEGRLDAEGTLGLSPPSLDWAVTARALPILPFKPYFSELLEVQVVDGAVSAKGRVALALPDTGPPQVSFKGDADVTDFATLDKVQMEDFLKWKTLHMGGVDAAASPVKVSIREVALDDFYSRLIVSPEGKLNLAQIVSANEATPPPAGPAQPWDQPTPDEPEGAAPPAPTATAPAQAPTAERATAETGAAPPFSVSVQNVTLSAGNINYTDHYIKPNYTANMTDVVGRIAGLSSDPATRADLEVRAKLDHQAPIEVTGTFNPIARPIFLDIKGKATDIELSPMSPYSGKFAGYIIQKGKLNVEVAYHVENGKLDATNHIFLDQFTLGDKVESKDATKLPVKLAIALLKDRQGRIDLTLPVSGSLNDPKFKVGRVILRIFVNLIAKAVTAPFALLGRMFGGHGETLSYVEFEPGRAILDAAAQAKVDQLAKALADRPGLRLDITGRFDPESDREGLKKVMVERRVKAEKLKELAREKAEAPPLDAVTVSPEEYPKLLFKAYRHMKFPKPRTVIGTAKELPVAEMEQLMLANTTVTDDDLRQLARDRAQAVKDAVLKPGGIDAGRVFLAAETKPSAEAAKAKPTRVDLSLR